MTRLQAQRETTLTSDPVNSDALHPTYAGSNNVLPPGLITFGSGNSVQAHVCPVHSVIPCEIQCKVHKDSKCVDEWGCNKTNKLMTPHFTAAWPISLNMLYVVGL